MARGFVVIACAVGAVACQSPVRELYGVTENIGHHVCQCYEERGFESAAACVAAGDLPNDAQLGCLEEVYDRYAESVQPTFDCLLPAARRLESCVASTDPCDEDAYTACGFSYTSATADCPPLPADPAADLRACDD